MNGECDYENSSLVIGLDSHNYSHLAMFHLISPPANPNMIFEAFFIPLSRIYPEEFFLKLDSMDFSSVQTVPLL